VEGLLEVTSVPSLLYSDVQDYLRDSLRDMLTTHCSWQQVLARVDDECGLDKKLWMRLAVELGTAGLAISAESGGGGGSWAEVGVVMEELGRAVADVPYLTSSVAATSLSQSIGATDVTTSLAGGAIVAVGVPLTSPLTAGAGSGVELVDGRLSGTIALVAGTESAEMILVPVGGAIVQVDMDRVTLDPVPTFDMTRRLSDLTFDSVAAVVLADGTQAADGLAHAADVTAGLLASEQLGLAERSLELTVEYLKERSQFGRRLGTYQALKHRLADVWTDITKARAVARYAAVCAATDSPDLPVAASLAQALCSDVAQRSAQECVQMHGGIGFTWEHPAHLYLKRARADALALGSAAWHRDRLGRLRGLTRPATSVSSFVSPAVDEATS
jgi:alkylation response protein AidB-like acyl-CoA dehydrogenase